MFILSRREIEFLMTIPVRNLYSGTKLLLSWQHPTSAAAGNEKKYIDTKLHLKAHVSKFYCKGL